MSSRTRTLVSTPLAPLSASMCELSARCSEFLAASAFLSKAAIDDVVGEALAHEATVKVLTGTFANTTRKATFKKLLLLQKRGEANSRIWDCGTHQNFHAKLYIWRLTGGRGVAWVGSANFTDGGLQNEGELILEVNGDWDTGAIKALRTAFGREWSRATEITADFVDKYREAAHVGPGFRTARRQPGVRRTPLRAGDGVRYFTANASYEVKDGSRTDERVQKLLGTADAWLHYYATGLGTLKRGDRCVYITNYDKQVALVEVTDFRRDGKAAVFSWEPVFSRNAWQPWNASTRRRVVAATGLRGRGRALGYRWLRPPVARALLKAIYPSRRNLPL